MKRSIPIIAAIAALAACGAATHWMLARPRMNPRMNYALNPPREIPYPHWVESFRGYANGGETGMTVVAWAKYTTSHANLIVTPFVMGSCTAESARPTREGGAPLTNLVTGTVSDAQTIDVSSGSWARECLPTGYAVPSTLAGSQWQYGCYCINVTTDTPLTLSVADTEIYIPATNGMVRNVQGSSASRYVIVTPESAFRQACNSVLLKCRCISSSARRAIAQTLEADFIAIKAGLTKHGECSRSARG